MLEAARRALLPALVVGSAVATLIAAATRVHKQRRRAKHRAEAVLKWTRAAHLTTSSPRVSFQRSGGAFYTKNPLHILNTKLVIATVGLPARGKSYLSNALIRYLTFVGCPAQNFNAGSKRRQMGLAGSDSSFFDSKNADAKKAREAIAMETLDELLDWLRSHPSGCACGVFDATNTTRARRLEVVKRCSQEKPPVQLIFLESICDDDEMLQHNYRMKLSNEDYKGSDAEAALSDFLARVAAYEKVYETITDEEVRGCARDKSLLPMRFMQTHNAGQKLVSHGCDGYLAVQALTLLQSCHLKPRRISIILSGQSMNEESSIRGGDAPLTSAGLEYAQAACALVRERKTSSTEALTLTGTLQRYFQLTEMLEDVSSCVLSLKALNDMCLGSLEGMRFGKLKDMYPQEYAARCADKLNYRFPGVGGESYTDLILRLREVILSVEHYHHDVIIVCDTVVARVIYGYYQGVPIIDIPNISLVGGVIEFNRSHSGYTSEQLPVDVGMSCLLHY